MKLLHLAFLITLVSAPVSASTIAATDAGSHVGQTATVEGVVTDVYTAKNGKTTFIDIGGRYPNSAFTVVIFQDAMAAVGDVSAFKDKSIDITGKIQSYQGKPEIIVRSREQLQAK